MAACPVFVYVVSRAGRHAQVINVHKVWSFTSATCSGTSVPSSGSLYTKSKIFSNVINYIVSIHYTDHLVAKFEVLCGYGSEHVDFCSLV